MKLFLIITTLSTLTVANPTGETGWKEIKSPLEHPRYAELLSKIYSKPSINEVLRGGRIVGGSPAARGQFPYQIFTYLDDAYL